MAKTKYLGASHELGTWGYFGQNRIDMDFHILPTDFLQRNQYPKLYKMTNFTRIDIDFYIIHGYVLLLYARLLLWMHRKVLGT